MKNNDYPSWLVPLDIAFQLKAIGFDEPCVFKFERCEYTTFKMNIDSVFEDTSEYYFDDLETYKEGYNTRGYDILRPTWEQTLVWFRKKNLVGLVSYRYRDKNNKGFSFEILDEYADVFLYKTYEQAQEALVYKLIEIYKSEQK